MYRDGYQMTKSVISASMLFLICVRMYNWLITCFQLARSECGRDQFMSAAKSGMGMKFDTTTDQAWIRKRTNDGASMPVNQPIVVVM